MTRGLALATLCGVVGALLWAAVAYLTGWSLGALAVLLGALVGAGMYLGASRRGTVTTGMAAAAVALLCVLAARFFIAQGLASDAVTRAAHVTEQDALDHYAAEVYRAYAATSRFMSEPAADETWPPEVLAEAERLWKQTPAPEREEYMAAVGRDAVREAEAARFSTGFRLFAHSFGPINLILIGLTVVTAYRTGAHNSHAKDEVSLAPAKNADGLVGGPLARGAPASGGGTKPSTVTPPANRKPAPKLEPDDEDLRSAGIFSRLNAIAEREDKKEADRKKAA
ncbi:MAG: hypothetical protein U0637_01505 [Phycisphaerales bacterium]